MTGRGTNKSQSPDPIRRENALRATRLSFNRRSEAGRRGALVITDEAP
jgi:hypothetical protein